MKTNTTEGVWKGKWYKEGWVFIIVLALLILAGRHAAADTPNVNAKPSPDLRVNGDIYEHIPDGFTSGKDSARRAKIAAGPNANATVSIDLITDGGAGNQIDDGVTSGTVSGQGTKIAVEVFAKGVTTPLNAVVIKFDFDASVLKVDKVENSAFPSPFVDATGATFLSISPVTLPQSGFLARAEFTTVADVTGREFSIGIATVSLQTDDITDITTNVISFNANPSPDFDGDGTVGIPDFLQFVNHFGTSRGGAGYDGKYDLDENGVIGIPDFLIFVNNFGSQVPTSGGGGGGGGGGGSSGSPDLIVESPSVSDNTLTMGQSFTLSATVRNQGTGSSAETTLRYYRSSNSTISTSDTEVGTDAVGSLNSSGTSAESISLNAPSSAGTYYYGACVESVSGESSTDNNCSDGVRVTVSSSNPDLIVESPSVSDNTLTTGQSFTLSATVRNQGMGPSAATTLRYYQSSNSTISASDTEVGTDSVGGLSASDTSAESISLNAPSSAGTYYYGACVNSVTGESDTDNNCSDAVTVTVSAPTSSPDLLIAPGETRKYSKSFSANFDFGVGESLAYRVKSSTVDDGLSGLSNVKVSYEGSQSTLTFTTRVRSITFSYNLRVSSTVPLNTTLRATIVYDVGTTVLSFRKKETYTVSLVILVRGSGSGGSSSPDLIVESPSVSDNTLTTGQSFTLSATVRNQGTGSSAETTLRYYRSSNATISTSDTEVGTDSVSGLSASGTSAESISLNAPSSAGTYYYGACVESVSGESDTNNNCSDGVSVTVSSSSSGGGSGSLGACRAGLVVNPNESCTYKDDYTFSVSSSGTGNIIGGGLFMSAGNSINERGTINGVRWNFVASKNSDSNSWTIHTAE